MHQHSELHRVPTCDWPAVLSPHRAAAARLSKGGAVGGHRSIGLAPELPTAVQMLQAFIVHAKTALSRLCS
jgi:hypothetical protein